MKTSLHVRLMLITGLAVAVAGSALIGEALGATAGKGRSLRGTAYVAAVPHPGSLVYDAGFTNDNLFGQGAVTFVSKALPGNVKGTIKVDSRQVVLWTQRGTLRGTGTALLTITNKPKPGDATASNGTLVLNRGSGALAGHSMTGTFSGYGNIGVGGPSYYVFRYKGTFR
jgi:hypothetical protein